MKLSISNIAWDSAEDEIVYSFMKENCFCGLEIAPTRIIPENPYDHIDEIVKWKKDIQFEIPSIQSILFGISWNYNRSQEEYDLLITYLKKAIDFASAIGSKNLVFGCPRNRSYTNDFDAYNIAKCFFKELGDYAYRKNTCIGMEPNPTIYNTNFINTTVDAINFIKDVSSKGLLLNLDLGTMIENNEDLLILENNVDLINHIHISEPYLENIKCRNLHNDLKKLLIRENYDIYISIEMKKNNDINLLKNTMRYVKNVFD